MSRTTKLLRSLGKRLSCEGGSEDSKSVSYSSMQNDPVVSKASELLRLGLMPTPEEVRSGKVTIFSGVNFEFIEGRYTGFAFYRYQLGQQFAVEDWDIN